MKKSISSKQNKAGLKETKSGISLNSFFQPDELSSFECLTSIIKLTSAPLLDRSSLPKCYTNSIYYFTSKITFKACMSNEI